MIFGFFKNSSRFAKVVVTGITTAAMVPVTVFLIGSSDIGAPMTAAFEGEVLGNYIDAVGVETWCIGETQLGRLEAGYTHDYCIALFKARYPVYSAQVYQCYDAKAKRYVTPAMHSAFTDVFYNAGATCKSGMIRFLKAGNPVAACKNILDWKKAGGKDCSIRSNGCYGVWDRRLKVFSMCINDAQRLPSEGIGQ